MDLRNPLSTPCARGNASTSHLAHPGMSVGWGKPLQLPSGSRLKHE